MTDDEMLGWHHRLDGHGFQQAPGVGDGQGGLACCDPWGRKESDTTEPRAAFPSGCLAAQPKRWAQSFQESHFREPLTFI